MGCNIVQQHILELLPLTVEEAEHVHHCTDCSSLQNDIEKLREMASESTGLHTPDELIQRTHLMALDMLTLKSRQAKARHLLLSLLQSIELPFSVNVSLIGFAAILGLIFLYSWIQDAVQFYLLFLIIVFGQNILMVLFAPVLLRGFAHRDRHILAQ